MCCQVSGQQVRLVGKNENYVKKADPQRFERVATSFDLTGYERVAVLAGYSPNSRKGTLADLFRKFWEMTNELGANAFVVTRAETISDTTHVEIDVYFFDKETHDRNYSLYPDNMVYVLGGLKLSKPRARKITFNGETILLHPLEYIAYQNKVGETTDISLGGALGAKYWIKGREGRLPEHFSTTGFGFGSSPPQGMGVSVHTGRLHPVELNFGQFLVQVFSRKGD